jgi:hypothetical protein
MSSQLLCTFTNKNEVQTVLQTIRETYTIVYNYIYILENKHNPYELFITYNVDTSRSYPTNLDNTILIHRKKESNTLYTINALNEMIKEQNGGVLDKRFIVDWNQYRNSVVLINDEGTVTIPTKIWNIIEFN